MPLQNLNINKNTHDFSDLLTYQMSQWPSCTGR